uniref:Uncharacterized protein n=1 Tax=Setaria viridis TaxID=4556 RepID=A0A4U6UFH5_SETVI|nr:hypothetical protein SEVIR_6G076325v2 [Setaria viridis]
MDDHRTIGKTNPERWLILWSIYAQVYGILDWRDTISCYYTGKYGSKTPNHIPLPWLSKSCKK